MKKVLSVFLALALIGSIAFAEINPVFSLGSYGKGLWNVAASNGSDIYSSLIQSWGAQAPRLGLNFRAETDNVRLVYDVHNNGQTTTTGNNGYIEIRPFPVEFPIQAAIAVGKHYMNETRIDAVYGMYNWYRLGPVNSSSVVDQEGFIFDSLLDYGNDGRDLAGVALRLYPIEGLTIGAGVPLTYARLDVAFNNNFTAADVWKDANFYVGYALPNKIGKVSLGWDGKWIEDADGDASENSRGNYYYSNYWGVIGAAFEFTMINNLRVAVGGKIPVMDAPDKERAIQVNAYANYSLGDIFPLGIHVLFGSKINELDTNRNSNSGFGFQVGLGVDYEVLDNVPIFLDLRYANSVYMAQNSDRPDSFAVGLGIARNFSNGNIGVAFELATGGYGNGYGYINDTHSYINSDGTRYNGIVWAIPIRFEYQF